MTAEVEPRDWLAEARSALAIEAAAITAASDRLGPNFLVALELIEKRSGKVVTVGVGKSGIAAHKIAATLSSTGCPATFLHPTEALHGDLGILEAGDVVIALSNSGESEEVLAILPAILRRTPDLVAIAGNPDSTLARRARVTLDASIIREACPLNLAPTASVVVAIALGDALATTLQKRRGLLPEEYAMNHPGGKLGKRLLVRVSDVFARAEADMPRTSRGALLLDVQHAISSGGMGAVAVVDGEAMLGLITDFDVRKAMERAGPACFERTAEEMMNRTPAVVLRPDDLAYDALRRMEERERPISVAPVLDHDDRYLGIVHVHDLLRAGV